MGTVIFRAHKVLTGFSTAHRQWRADSHCSFIHGYERSFRITFACSRLDPLTGFVFDFGALGPIKEALAYQFDHTLVVAEDDPLLTALEQLEAEGGCQLRPMPHPGMEGAAEWVFDLVDEWVRKMTEGRCWVESVEAREHDRNSASVERATRASLP